jgi:hypothetical protein
MSTSGQAAMNHFAPDDEGVYDQFSSLDEGRLCGDPKHGKQASKQAQY